MSPGHCYCPKTSRHLSPCDGENCIPGHTRDCSLRTVSPLMDTNLINRKLLPTDSADTAIAQQFAKRYELLRKENQSLRQTVIEQEEQIDKLKALLKSLQSDGYSSESRYDKSSSSNSNIPTLRVTPQKRSSTSSSTQTPRSPRSPRSGRRAARRLQFPESSESESTPTQQRPVPPPRTLPSTSEIIPRQRSETYLNSEPRSIRPPLRRNLESPEAAENRRLENIVLGELSGRRNTRPIAASRTISSLDGTPQSTSTRTPSRQAARPSRFTTDENGTNVEPSNGNPLPNLAFYLQRFRPDFLRNSEGRQQIIRDAATQRAQIEAARKEIAIRFLNGGNLNKLQEKILQADPTRIKAFSPREMSASTKKRVSSTKEHVKKKEDKVKHMDREANRLLAAVHSQRTRTRVIRGAGSDFLTL